MRQPVKSKLFPDSADNFCLNKNFHHTIFGLDVSKSIPNLPTCADRPLHCKWAFKKIEAFKKILYPPMFVAKFCVDGKCFMKIFFSLGIFSDRLKHIS